MMEMLRDVMKKWWNAWCEFFFAPTPMLPLGIFRFVFGLNAFIMYSIRFMEWRFYYTDEGFVSSQWATEILPEFTRPMLLWFPTHPATILLSQIVLLIALLCLCLGIFGRLAALIALLLHLAFLQRNFSIAYGADIVSTFFLFFLAWTDNDRLFSLRRFLGWVREPMGDINQMCSTIGVRLLQIQMCLIYGYTGLEKMKGHSWWDGTAVWSVIGNSQLMMVDLSWLKHFPLVIAAATFLTLLFEVYFPIVVWIRPLKGWFLALGYALHAGIAFTVGLVFFSVAMVSTYFVFMDADWLKQQLLRLRVPIRFLE